MTDWATIFMRRAGGGACPPAVATPACARAAAGPAGAAPAGGRWRPRPGRVIR